MKTADEMFKDLGYEKYEDKLEVIFSKDFYCKHRNKTTMICFMKSEKRLDLSGYFLKNSSPITIEELQAINKKADEMGWFNGDSKKL